MAPNVDQDSPTPSCQNISDNSSEKPASIVPIMGVGSDFDPDGLFRPFRVSGILCLLLGLLSITALVGYVMIAVPVLALVFGLFALRKWDGPKPTGLMAARIGMVLALVFGMCGFFIHQGRATTLGNQAEYFARQYLKIVGEGEFEIARELKKSPVDRLPIHMPLKEHYQAIDELADEEGPKPPDSEIDLTVYAMGSAVDWQIKRPTRIYYYQGHYIAEMLFTTPPGTTSTNVLVSLEYEVDSNGLGQWRVHQCHVDRERIVAESVL